MSGWVDWVTLAAALGAGLVAGVWFAFSGFVMAALDRLPPERAADAMREINVMAPRPPLMLAMFGTGVLCLVLGVWAVGSWGDDRAPWLLAGGAVYWIGSNGVTMALNVPLNNALAGDLLTWERYRGPWTARNTARLVASLAAAALLTAGLAA
jgi:uncharacterized membrane protein